MAPLRSISAVAAFLLTLFAAVQTRGGPVRLPDREQDGFVGPVHTVTVTVERMSGGALRRDRLEVLTYDPTGDLAERVVYDGENIVARVTYRYDAAGVRHITSTTRDGVGLGIPATRLRPRENPLTAPAENPDGTFAFCSTGAYSANGRIVEEKVFSGDDPPTAGKLVRTIYRFAAGVLPSEMLQFSGSPERTITRETYTYGPDGRVSEMYKYGPSNVLAVKTSYTYELDARGNWIARTETTTLSGAPVVTVRRRAITYYDDPGPAKK